MDKTDIRGDVGQIIKADTANIESSSNVDMTNNGGVNCESNAGTIINGQVNNYSLNIAVKPADENADISSLSAKHREVVSKVFIGGLFFVGTTVALKVLADDPLGWIGELLTFTAALGVIAASALIFKSR